jgi:hypothetical protein
LWGIADDTTVTQALGHPALLPKTVLDLALGPDGQTLASSDENGSVFLWDLATREQIGRPLTGHTGEAWITAVAFDPTGRFFASGSLDRTSREKPVVIWDASSRAEFVVFPSLHTGWINDIAFSEDGQTLASASQDGTVILWELDPAVWRKRVCDRAGRNLREAERTEYLDGAGANLCPDQPSFGSASAGSPTATVARGDHVAAAQFLGATETVREASHQDRLSNYAHRAQTIRAVRTGLGESAFTAAWDAGRPLSVEEAVTFVHVLGLRSVTARPSDSRARP